MIYKSIIVILLFLCLIMSCESPNESYIDAAQYYPLKIGNKWYYSSDQTDTSFYNVVKEIVGDTIINNKSYYKSVSYYLPPSTNRYVSYSRVERSKLFIGMMANINGTSAFEENLTADFSLKIGDTLRINQYEYFTIAEQDESIIKIFHQSSGIRSWTKYQKGIGVIEGVSSNAIIHRTVLVKSELK